MSNPSIVSNPASNTSGRAPARMMNDVDLCVWVADARSGDSITYYTGHLSRDRLPHKDGYAIEGKIDKLYDFLLERLTKLPP